MGKVDITFILPPMGSIYEVYITVPLLTGYSRSIGLKAAQIDASIGFNRYLFSRAGILKHRPGKSAPLGLLCLWEFLCENIEKVWSPTEGDDEIKFIEALFIQQSGYYYYSSRYQNTEFGDYFLRQKRMSTTSSSSILAAARYLSVQRNHPLTRYYREHILKQIGVQQPRILGISVSNRWQLLSGLVLVILLRRKGLSCHVTMGGNFVSDNMLGLDEKKRFFDSLIDSYVIEDGEPALEGFKRLIDGKCTYNDIDNLCLPGRGVKKPLKYTDINKLPVPKFDNSILKKYRQPVRLPVELSRGCYWGKCAFCSQMPDENARYRPVDVKVALDRLVILKKKFKQNNFLFTSLSASPRQLRDLATQIRERNLSIRWFAWFRLDKVITNKLLKEMVRMGFSSYNPAPESFCQRTLDNMSKGYEVKHIIRILKCLVKMGVCTPVNAIVGFPGETEAEFMRTIEICRRNKFNPVFWPFTLWKKSRAFSNPDKYGIKIHHSDNEESDLDSPVGYSMKKGVPHYRWEEEVRPKIIARYGKRFEPSNQPFNWGDTLCFDQVGCDDMDDSGFNADLIYPMRFCKNTHRYYALIVQNTQRGALTPVNIYFIDKNSYNDFLNNRVLPALLEAAVIERVK